MVDRQNRVPYVFFPTQPGSPTFSLGNYTWSTTLFITFPWLANVVCIDGVFTLSLKKGNKNKNKDFQRSLYVGVRFEPEKTGKLLAE